MSKINEKVYIVEAFNLYEKTIKNAVSIYNGVVLQEKSNSYVISINTADETTIIKEVLKVDTQCNLEKALIALQNFIQPIKEKQVKQEAIVIEQELIINQNNQNNKNN